MKPTRQTPMCGARPDRRQMDHHGGSGAGEWAWLGCDPLVTPLPTVEFYEALAWKSGGMSAVQEFARLFMVPGMDHCGIGTEGPGISDTGIDPLTALERWVEEGKAPNELIATKTTATGGQTLWKRPVCAYPKVARYKGSGDAADAASFTCAEP
jgi:Tannase and feruloyl esterase